MGPLPGKVASEVAPKARLASPGDEQGREARSRGTSSQTPPSSPGHGGQTRCEEEEPFSGPLCVPAAGACAGGSRARLGQHRGGAQVP